ncbi:Hypothetical predicted protein, partial [Mytilus galloprovincialis]
MVVTLLSRVDELTIDIKKLKRFTSSTKSQLEDTTDQTCHLRKTPTVKSNKRKTSTVIPNERETSTVKPNEQKTPTVKANERSGTLQDSQNINEDNDLFGGNSGSHTDSTKHNFDCGISSQILSHETQPDGRENNSYNTDNFAQTVNRIQNSDRRDGNFVFSSYETQLDRTNKTDTEDKFADKVHRTNYSDRKDGKTNVSSNEAQIDQPNNTDTEDSFSVEETQDKDNKHDSESNDSNINVSISTACADMNENNNESVLKDTRMLQNQQLADNVSKLKNFLDVGTVQTMTKDNITANHVKRVCKNDSGYKQIRSAMSSDNRVAYHKTKNSDTKDSFSGEETKYKEEMHDSEGCDNNINVSLDPACAELSKLNEESVTNILPNQPPHDNISRLKNSGDVRTVKTKTKEKDTSSSINRVCKNDFGYKQKRSAISSDNRVAYHNKETCFEFEHDVQSDKPLPEDPPPSPNIKNKSHPTR